jgi:hypothetical protein
MSLRVEVQPGGKLELLITRINNGRVRRVEYTDIPAFFRVFYYLIKIEIEREKAERFTSAIDIECRRLLKLKLKEREQNGSEKL